MKEKLDFSLDGAMRVGLSDLLVQLKIAYRITYVTDNYVA